MNPEIHERACRLINAWHVEGISATEREWLDAHLVECTACRARAAPTSTHSKHCGRIRLALIPPSSARRRRAFACGLVSCAKTRHACARFGFPVRSRGFWAWRARHLSGGPSIGSAFTPRLPSLIWETAFAVWWLLPAGAVAVLIAWNQRRAANQEGYTSLPR